VLWKEGRLGELLSCSVCCGRKGGWVSCQAILCVVEGREKHFYRLFRSHHSQFITSVSKPTALYLGPRDFPIQLIQDFSFRIKRPIRDTDQTLPSTAEGQNEWSYKPASFIQTQQQVMCTTALADILPFSCGCILCVN
jgi:hypothetical protein